jgi:hypothetical protein
MILEEISLRGYRLPGVPRTPRPTTIDTGTDGTSVAPGELLLERIDTIAVAASADDYFQFLEIPVMAARFSSGTGVPLSEVPHVLDVIRTQLGWVPITVPPQIWKIVVLTRSKT